MYNNGNSSKNVTGASVVDGTVETVDIADDAVTADKLANSVNADIGTGVTASTTAGDALPKAGGAMTGAITTNSTFDGVDVATRDGVLTTTTTTANAALPKAGGAMTGAITTNSTFDGVDVATRDGVLTTTTTTANAALPKAGGTMTGTIAGFTSTGIDDNATSTAITIDASNNVGIGQTSTGKKLEVLASNGAVALQRGSGNSQGSAYKFNFLKQLPVVSSGNKIIIPFTNQGSLNSTTICKVMGHSARWNYGDVKGFELTFEVGHLGSLGALNVWNTGGNYSSIAINGMNVEITLGTNYIWGTIADGVFVSLEYMTNHASFSIDEANVRMN
jgi:hypothetical protein